MATNQEGRLAAVQTITGTALGYNGDWHALFTHDSIAAGTFNERLLSWINTRLGTSYTSLHKAQPAYAAAHSFTLWSDINTIGASG